MLCLATHYNCAPHIAAIVAALTVQELFKTGAKLDINRFEAAVEAGDALEVSAATGAKLRPMEQWKLEGLAGGGDIAAMLSAVGAADHVYSSGGDLNTFCEARCLRLKAIKEVHKLRTQLARARPSFSRDSAELDDEDNRDGQLDQLAPPTVEQQDAIRQIFLAGFGDHVARLSTELSPEESKANLVPYRCAAVDEPVFIHPESVLHSQKPGLVVYHEMIKGKTRYYMKGVTVINLQWLPRLVPSLCTFAKPLDQPEPWYDSRKDDVRCHMSGSFGDQHWPLPAQVCTLSW